MSLRRKIGQILRRVSGIPETQTQVQHPFPVEEKSPIIFNSPSEPISENKIEMNTPDSIPELILYGRPSCPYCARVDRVIAQMDIEEKITRRLTTYGSEWRAELRDRTGSTQVPCLFIDGKPMFESLDIIDWLQDNLS